MTFEEWKDDYGLVYEPNYCKETEADCKAAFKSGAASRDAEIESLRQQIDNLAVDITLLRRQVSALEKQDGELESMRQQLAAAQATIKAKDDYLRLLIGYTSESTVASLIVQKALAATEPKP